MASFCKNAEANTGTLLRYPYIQNVKRTTVTVRWTTIDPGIGSVLYSADQRNYLTVEAKTREFLPEETGRDYPYYRHEAAITGLTPGTDYFYSVSLNDQDLIRDEDLTFRTTGANAFEFLMIGDSGTGSVSQNQLAARMVKEKPKLLIHTGDLAYPSSTYQRLEQFYFDYYRSMMKRVPFFPCLGNHDYYDTNAIPYLAVHDVPTEDIREGDHGRYYSFDWGNAHFISLDTNTPLANAAQGRGEMLTWLERDLQKTRKFWRIVFFHHPPFAYGPNADDPLSELVRKHIVPILERHHVPVVFSGHEHSFQRTHPLKGGEINPSGTTYFTTGGGGAPLYPVHPAPQLAKGASVYHFLKSKLDGHSLNVRAISPEGKELDESWVRPLPFLSDRSVLNSASFGTEIAAGGLISVFGIQLAADQASFSTLPLPLELADVWLSVNGKPIPLLMVSPTQVNAQLPADALGDCLLALTTPNGRTEVEIHVTATAPALFANALFHQNGLAVTRESPARTGQTVSIFLTGMGAVDEAGQVAAPVSILIDGQRVSPVTAAAVPATPGLYKVELLVPARTSPCELRIQAGTAVSNEAILYVQ